MVQRVQIKPRRSRPREEKPAAAAPEPTAGSDLPDTVAHAQNSQTAVPPESQEDENDEEMEIQARALASQLLGDDSRSSPSVSYSESALERVAARETGGGLQFKAKVAGAQTQTKRKHRRKLSVEFHFPQMDHAAAIFFFLVGTVLLAASMFGIDGEPQLLSPLTLLGICSSQAVFMFLFLTPNRTMETFARTLVGALTLFAALTAVGVFLAEAFLVPILGFSLVRNMPSAPLTGSATFIFAACLILVARDKKPNWTLVLLCLLVACIIPVLPVQHFMHLDLNLYRRDFLHFLTAIRLRGF